ncbi:MAG: 1-acyl-sn-glycerol-3-phosphate acyltransferase [Dehalococcoidia bacterium]|nr:1-acyl-sn-glycerol-3-phosphate acyltransferase [Dehalococcoidia bacterium]
MPVCYKSILARVPIKCLFRTRVLNPGGIPHQGPIIIVSNHSNYADPVVLIAVIARRLAIMAKEELFEVPLLGAFLRCGGCIPVKRHTADRAALRNAGAVLRSGGAICMFPEGTRSKDGRLLPGQPGATFLALHSGVPIIPVGIIGTHTVHGPMDLLRRPEIVVNVGKPFSITTGPGTPTGQTLQNGTEMIMFAIARLLPPEQRGAYESVTTDKLDLIG